MPPTHAPRLWHRRNCHTSEQGYVAPLIFSLFAFASIAFVVEPDRSGAAALLSVAAPDAIVVFGQVADVRKAVLLQPALRFAHSEAVGAFSRGRGIRVGRGNRLVVVTRRRPYVFIPIRRGVVDT